MRVNMALSGFRSLARSSFLILSGRGAFLFLKSLINRTIRFFVARIGQLLLALQLGNPLTGTETNTLEKPIKVVRSCFS